VGVVGGAVLQRPRHHRLGDLVGEAGVERFAVLQRRLQLVEGVRGEALPLLVGVEDVFAERFVLGKGQIERAQRLPVGAPLRCGYVLLADTSHRLVIPSLGGAPGIPSANFVGLTPY
jgi:hypothetical protein